MLLPKVLEEVGDVEDGIGGLVEDSRVDGGLHGGLDIEAAQILLHVLAVLHAQRRVNAAAAALSRGTRALPPLAGPPRVLDGCRRPHSMEAADELAEVCKGSRLCQIRSVAGSKSSRCFQSRRCDGRSTTPRAPESLGSVITNAQGTPCPGATTEYDGAAGRLGDRLRVLARVLRLAESDARIKFVHIARTTHTANGKEGVGFDRFLRYDSCIPLRAPPPAASRSYFGVMQYYIVPRLDLQFVRPPTPAHDHELVIHLRSGDMRAGSDLQAISVEAAMPPCAFYEHAISRFSVRRIRVITEPDKQHPCIPLIEKRGEVVVQSSTREQDAAAIIHATYFIPSPSWFSYTMVNLNSRVKKIVYFDPASDGSWSGRWLYPCRDGVSIERATIADYRPFVPGNGSWSTRAAALARWMRAPYAGSRFHAMCAADGVVAPHRRGDQPRLVRSRGAQRSSIST